MMKIEAKTIENNCIVVSAEGRLDHSCAPIYQKEIESHCDKITIDGPALILDFSNISYVASVGLRVLMIVARRIHAQKGRVVICNPQPSVHEVFTISRFNLLFKIHDSVESAVLCLGEE